MRALKVGPSNLDLVLVEWVDSSRIDGWHNATDLRRSVNACVSVGWLVESRKDAVVISPHMANNADGDFDQMLGTITIPRVAVGRIRTLWRARTK